MRMAGRCFLLLGPRQVVRRSEDAQQRLADAGLRVHLVHLLLLLHVGHREAPRLLQPALQGGGQRAGQGRRSLAPACVVVEMVEFRTPPC